MRVLSVGPGLARDPLLRALTAAGCSVTCVGLHETPPRRTQGETYFYIGNAFEQIKVPIALSRIRRALADAGAPYVWWNRDAPWNCRINPARKILMRMARRVDIHLAHSLQSVHMFGSPVTYFPNAAETDRYNLSGRSLSSLRERDSYRFAVSFVGTVHPEFRMVRERVAFLAELRRRLEAKGIKLHVFDTSIGSTLSVPEQVDIIQRSRVNLSVGAVCDQPVRSWGLPERCFGIAACGGFLLCDTRKHAADTFPADVLDEFSDVEDCVAQIRYFLERFELTRDRAEKLHRVVMERHTYANRASQLLRLVVDWIGRQTKAAD